MKYFSQRGVVMAMFAVFVPLFIGFMGLVIDMGKLYADHIEMQNTADSLTKGSIKSLKLSDGSAPKIVKAEDITPAEYYNLDTYETNSELNSDQKNAITNLVNTIGDLARNTIGIKDASQSLFRDADGNVYYQYAFKMTANTLLLDSVSKDINVVSIAMLDKDSNILTGSSDSSDSGTNGKDGPIINPSSNDGGDTDPNPKYNSEVKSIDNVSNYYFNRSKSEDFKKWADNLTNEEKIDWLDTYISSWKSRVSKSNVSPDNLAKLTSELFGYTYNQVDSNPGLNGKTLNWKIGDKTINGKVEPMAYYTTFSIDGSKYEFAYGRSTDSDGKLNISITKIS